jgi:hypothetical protein
MTRRNTYNHRSTPHTSIVMPYSRALAIKRAAQSQGVSSHVIIQRFISAGLVVFAEVDNGEDTDAE